MKKPTDVSPQDALVRLQSLCSRSEKCIYDVRGKLALWKVEGTEADKLVDKLVADGFIDEQRYARAYVREKSTLSKWGVQKISRMLSAKRLPEATVKMALGELNAERYEADLLKLLTKKNGSLKAASKAIHTAKLLRFALSRGYEYELSLKIIEKIMK